MTSATATRKAPEIPDQSVRRAPRGAPSPLNRAERAALGKAARSDVPLASHVLSVPAERADPVGLLEEQATSRVPELVPLRYGRMLASPFAFYRGAALVMATDLAATPTTDLYVQLCGDAHLSNFGVFASPERHLVFDINDFDETLPGPFEWDVKRLAASLEVAARGNGFRRKERRQIVLRAVQRYRCAMREFAQQSNLAVWYAHLDMDREMPRIIPMLKPGRARRTEEALAKARTRDSTQAFTKLATLVNGQPHILSDPPLVVRATELLPEVDAGELFLQLRGMLRSYGRTLQSDRRHLLGQYQLVDLARKVVGVGSVGTRAWILLLQECATGDPLFLQAKEAQASVLERYVRASAYRNHGARVVTGQHVMQASSDIFLGWERSHGLDGVDRDYYIRQLRDWKGSIVPEEMLHQGMSVYGDLCGWTLARAHARSGDRIAIASYLGKTDTFDQAVADFAEAYADQNEKDHSALQKAATEGRIQSRPEL